MPRSWRPQKQIKIPAQPPIDPKEAASAVSLKYVTDESPGIRRKRVGSGFTYVDVGVNIDVKRVTRVQDELMLDLIAETSGAVDGATPPIIRQTKWNSTVLIPIRKSVNVFSSDDPASKRQLQLDVTATPIK